MASVVIFCTWLRLRCAGGPEREHARPRRTAAQASWTRRFQFDILPGRNHVKKRCRSSPAVAWLQGVSRLIRLVLQQASCWSAWPVLRALTRRGNEDWGKSGRGSPNPRPPRPETSEKSWKSRSPRTRRKSQPGSRPGTIGASAPSEKGLGWLEPTRQVARRHEARLRAACHRLSRSAAGCVRVLVSARERRAPGG
jgi:hypothetical protein